MARQIRELVYQITNFPKGMLHSGRGLVFPPEYAFYFNRDRTMKNPQGLMEGLGKWFLLQHIRNLQERTLASRESALRWFLWIEPWGEKKEGKWFCFGVWALHPCILTPTSCCLSSPASADINTSREWKGWFFKNKRANEEGRIELHGSYVSFLGTSYFIVKGGTTPAKEMMRACHWISYGLFVNNFLTW